MKKILVTGANGQLGWEIKRTAPDNYEVMYADRGELDITDRDAVNNLVGQFAPDVVINSAAYTAVDKAESDEAAAHAVNVEGARNIAAACHQLGSKLIHISTDFVFDGLKSSPYLPTDKTNPLSVYGQTKRDGEVAVMKENPEMSVIIRTSWLYSSHGNNFVKTMLRLFSERDELGVVADQVGTPTWAGSLAEIVWALIEKGQPASGIYHWSDAGVASWYDLAVAVKEEAIRLGMLQSNTAIMPIATTDYPTPAARPPYSVLDKSGLSMVVARKPVHWRETLKIMLQQVCSVEE